MSIFSSSTKSSICPDYFGDEFGVPLPATTQQKTVTKSDTTETKDNAPVAAVKPQRSSLAFALNFDGLDFFETVVKSSN